MTDIVQHIINEAEAAGSIDAPYLVQGALIATALNSGNLSPEKIAAVIAALPARPSQFWRLAATAAANLHDPATEQIVESWIAA